MKPFDRPTIRRYVAGGEPLDKAGAYAVQGRGRHLVARVSGSLTNVVGLPLERLSRLLATAGVSMTSRNHLAPPLPRGNQGGRSSLLLRFRGLPTLSAGRISASGRAGRFSPMAHPSQGDRTGGRERPRSVARQDLQRYRPACNEVHVEVEYLEQRDPRRRVTES